MLLEIVIALIVVGILLYYKITKTYAYWKEKGVAFIPLKFPFGVLHGRVFNKEPDGIRYQSWYSKYKAQGLKYVGAFFFNQPVLIVLDQDIAKAILIKDFNHFVSRNFLPTTHEFISKHLFSLDGQEWREMRTKLTPTFTSGKMKNMFLLMEKCALQLQEHLESSVLQNDSASTFLVKDMTARFTTDIIATCAFGLEVDSIKNRENEFYKIAQLVFVNQRFAILKFLLVRFVPSIAKLLNIQLYNPKVSEFLKNILQDTISYRKNNKITRNDFIDLLLKVKENKQQESGVENDTAQKYPEDKSNHSTRPETNELSLEAMTAQAFVFFAAGFETAASTTSFCLYELAKHPEIQETLKREVDEVMAKHGGHVSYQAIQEMNYLEQVVNETLRMYASIPILTRVCTTTYRLPDSDLVIDKGVRVSIPAYAFHHDPDIYPEPDTFDPERFTESHIRERHPLSFMPFGDGPRNCIGLRFGRLQVKVGLIAILSKFRLSPAPDTPSSLQLDPDLFFTTPKTPFSLRISRRDDI